MAWKQKVVFAVLVAVVTSAFLAGVSTIIGFLLSAEVPDDTTIPPPTPDPLLEDEFLSVVCPIEPLDSTVILPCEVTLPDGQNVSSVNARRCSNRLCVTAAGECSTGRCCCQVFQDSQMEFSCPNQNDFILTTVERCACQLCGEDLLVTFLGTVQSTSGDPIILANVTEGNNSYITNSFGVFGFTVPASQEEVTISVAATQFAEFSRTYTVIPGELNTVSVLLQEVIMVMFVPENVPIIVSTSTLEITAVDENFTAVEPTRVGETFVMLSADFFEENITYTFVSTSVNIAMDQDIEASDIPFTVRVESNRRRRDVRRQSGTSTTEVYITAVAIGTFSILRDGTIFGVNSNQTIIVSTQFINSTFSEGELRNSMLYVLSNGELFLGNGTPNVRQETNNSFVIEFELSNIVFPLEYVIAFQENETCFVAVRAFDDNGDAIDTEVQVVSRVDERKVNKAYGNTSGCVQILCEGTLTITLTDTLEYTPGNHTVENVSGLIQQVDGPIYDNEDMCNSNNAYNFTQSSVELPPTSVTPVANTSQSGFCTVEIEVIICPGRMVQVIVAGDVTDLLNSTEMVANVIGSGIMCVKEHPLCVLIPCNSQVNVSVEQFVDVQGVDSQFCVPSRVLPNGPLLDVVDMNMTAMFEVNGVPASREAALPICSVTRGENAGIRFQCFI